VYNVQVQDDAADGIHADWSGSHAAATYEALRMFHLAMMSAHIPDDAVRQVEWGAYECTLRGHQVRRVIERALNSAQDWRAEPLETLHVGRTRLVGFSGLEPSGSRTLGWLHDHLQEGHVYLLTAEIFE
jgi:hypothetical protein